ncbi:hypothetical protein GQ55_9G528600 [Panicum hallii var. hallii]|uniref:Uncharacterized protein n=1 Tax=Panicum hallii var. hallii TaxID=1504633 RepID=A0A2T7CEF9_9POAL|nr:hypothetical protein GQ55_9G528600 [Panicum hallii var. hallii]PUZ41737.1 hypothetical protein GQ55_9G528600 [Panicum hallii var. hallii]
MAAACPGPCPATPWTWRRRRDSPRSTVRRRRRRGRACSFEATPRKVGDGWRRKNRGGRFHGSDWKSFSSSPGSRGGSRSGGDPASRPGRSLTFDHCRVQRSSRLAIRAP